ncbi:PTB domain engulfment adapter [Wolffia australiana]
MAGLGKLAVARDWSSSSAKFVRRGEKRDRIYVAAVPLRAAGPAQGLFSAGYSLRLWELQHFMVLIDRRECSSHDMKISVFDFQPCDPESIYVALAALSRKKVPGTILKRTLHKLPKTRCWFIGLCEKDAMEAANQFNQSWDNNLIIGAHDCRHYTNGLVQELTGMKNVVEDLRRKGFEY